MEFTKEDNKAIKWCEDNYKELTDEYKKIMMEQYVLFCKKHRNYGTGNINVGTNLDSTDGLKELKMKKIKKKQNTWLCILKLVQEKHMII